MNHNFDKTNIHYVNSFKHNVEKWPNTLQKDFQSRFDLLLTLSMKVLILLLNSNYTFC